MRRPARGVTLLEVLVVVAIVAILSAIAAGGLQSLVSRTRVAQTGRTLASALRNTRLRAVATGCFHFAQVNGPQYAGVNAGVVGFPTRRNTVSIVRKANCDATLPVFQPGDQVVDSFPMHDGPLASVQFDVPPLLGTTLGNNAFTVGWDRTAARFVAADTGGGGALSFVDVTAAAPNPITVGLTALGSGVTVAGGAVAVPTNGHVRYP